jgi:hypothetical protein
MEEWETGWNRDVLERIVALLFSLADLADRTVGLSVHRRRHVLGILRGSEAEAWAFLIGGMAPSAPAPTDAPDTADDALRLAARLRALALLLMAFLAREFTLPGAANPSVGRQTPAWWADCQALLPAPDTS